MKFLKSMNFWHSLFTTFVALGSLYAQDQGFVHLEDFATLGMCGILLSSILMAVHNVTLERPERPKKPQREFPIFTTLLIVTNALNTIIHAARQLHRHRQNYVDIHAEGLEQATNDLDPGNEQWLDDQEPYDTLNLDEFIGRYETAYMVDKAGHPYDEKEFV